MFVIIKEIEKSTTKKGAFSNTLSTQPFSFTLTSRTGRVFYLACDSEEDKQVWILKLREARDKDHLYKVAVARSIGLETELSRLHVELESREEKWAVEKHQLQDLLYKSSIGELAMGETREILRQLEAESEGLTSPVADENSPTMNRERKEQSLKEDAALWR